jgi:5-(carboxyamino)imidazole ribonucleotide mutase
MFNNKKQITKIAIVMGSQSDYTVMKDCEKILKILKIKFETKIVSAHRTPDRMFNFAKTATKNKFSVIVAGAGGSAHLPGMIASMTVLPVIGVPIESKKLKGLDSLLSVCQMPSGVPVATVAIDSAFNAGLLAASIVSIFDSKARSNLNRWKKTQTNSVKKRPK